MQRPGVRAWSRKRRRLDNRSLKVESLESRQVLSGAGWSVAIGGSGTDEATQVSTDSDGNAYVAGYVDGQDGYAASRAFVAKYDSTGIELWNRTATNNAGGDSGVWRMASDSAGNLYAAGWFSGGIEFASGHSLTADDTDSSTYDGFLAKYDTNGDLQWVHQQSDYVWNGDLAIHEDPVTGTHIYLFGENTQAMTYDGIEILPNDLGHTAAYLIDVIDTGTSGVVDNVNQVQQQGRIRPGSLAVNSSGEIYLIGEFNEGGGRGDDYPIAKIGDELLTSNGWYDPFLAKFSSDLTPDWALHLGGDTGTDSGETVTLDGDGNIYISGGFRDSFKGDFEIGGVPLPSENFHYSVYIAKLTDTGVGADVLWAKNIGGGEDQGRSNSYSLVVDQSLGSEPPSVFVAGTFNETVDFDPDPNQDHLVTSTVPPSSSVHDTDEQGFLLRLSGNGEFEDVWQFGDIVNEVTANADGSMFATGAFAPDSSAMMTQNLQSNGGEDGFLLRFNPNAPKVGLTSDGVVTEGIAANFNATAQDVADGDLSAQVDWTLDGVAYESDLSAVTISGLSVGSHTLVGSVVDSDGIVGIYTLTFDVLPAAPDLFAAAIDGTSVTLSWNDRSGGETGFIIERAVRPKGKADLVWQQMGEVGANETSFTDSNLASGNYIYRVRAIAEIAVDEVLSSVWSDEFALSLSDGEGGGGGKGGGKPKK